MHPLVKDLSGLTDMEIQDKISTLLNRMHFATTYGRSQMYEQLNNIYWLYMQEQYDRAQRSYIKDEDHFGDLIDIRKK